MQSQPPTFLLQFSSSDTDLQSQIEKVFGDRAMPIHSRQFDASLVDVIQYILPLIPSAAQFLFDYLASQKGELAKKRVLITKNGELSLQGYSAKEVEAILAKLSQE